MSITLVIIAITCVTSFWAFNNQKAQQLLIFYPPAITNNNEWYRFFSCGFIHADISHLAFNMFSFYLFGDIVEKSFAAIFGIRGYFLYLSLYLIALAVALLPTYYKNQRNTHYYSLGASGAVSAIVFAGILFYPTIKIGLFVLPPIIPGFIFGPLYLLVTVYLSRNNNDHINHSAHFWGAAFGISYVLVTCLLLSNFNPISNFTTEVTHYFM